jgi:hypothetical protein
MHHESAFDPRDLNRISLRDSADVIRVTRAQGFASRPRMTNLRHYTAI